MNHNSNQLNSIQWQLVIDSKNAKFDANLCVPQKLTLAMASQSFALYARFTGVYVSKTLQKWNRNKQTKQNFHTATPKPNTIPL